MDNPEYQDHFFGGVGQITVPKTVINGYVKNKFFRNALYITDIGYSATTTMHHHQPGASNTASYILIYCLGGEGRYQTQDITFIVKANHFMLLPLDQSGSFQLSPEISGSIYWVRFSCCILNELRVDLDFQKHKRPSQPSRGNEILEALQKIYSSLSDGFALENIGYANFNLYHLISLFVLPYKAEKNVWEDEDKLEKSISFMKENLQKPLTVESIAREFSYSSSHYSTLFKQKTGLSPIDYFIRIKIRHACQLLSQTNLIIKEIAQKVGYDDPFYFSRIFKKITGKSPIEYKGSLKTENRCATFVLPQPETTYAGAIFSN